MIRQEKQPQPSAQELGQAPNNLIEFVKEQFETAYQQEDFENSRNKLTNNGSFYKREVLAGPHESPIIEGTTRIVMCPPISATSDEKIAELAEIYARFSTSHNGFKVADSSGFFADQFIVRLYQDNHSLGYELVTDSGTYPADFSEANYLGGIPGIDTENEYGKDADIESIIENAGKPILRSHELFNLLSTYNIIATNS